MKKIINIFVAVILFFSLAFTIYVSAIVITANQRQETPRIFGYQLYYVLTESMSPNIPAGSMIFVKTVDIDQINNRDVITFFSTEFSSTPVEVTHRVVDVDDTSGQIVITTRGDANSIDDINKVTEENLIGRVEFKITFLGFMLGVFDQRNIIILGIVVIILIFVILEGTSLVKLLVRYRYEKQLVEKMRAEVAEELRGKEK
jgi:signal peptidase I